MSAANGRDEVADRLYALPPADFVEARDQAVREARAAGDKAGAAAIGKLRRPTVAAWLVNLLAQRRPNLLAEFLALGVEIRGAQHDLRGSALRELASRRRAAVHALVSEAVALAIEAGAARSSLPTAEVEATLAGALADESIAADVRAGRTVKAGEYSGFGPPSRPVLRVIPGGGESEAVEDGDRQASDLDGDANAAGPANVIDPTAARPTGPGVKSGAPDAMAPPSRTDTRRAEADAAVRRLAEARAAMTEAETGYDEAAGVVEQRGRQVTDIEEQLTDLRRRRVAAHSALLDAQAAQDVAAATVESARRRLNAAERAAKRGT